MEPDETDHEENVKSTNRMVIADALMVWAIGRERKAVFRSACDLLGITMADAIRRYIDAVIADVYGEIGRGEGHDEGEVARLLAGYRDAVAHRYSLMRASNTSPGRGRPGRRKKDS